MTVIIKQQLDSSASKNRARESRPSGFKYKVNIWRFMASYDTKLEESYNWNKIQEKNIGDYLSRSAWFLKEIRYYLQIRAEP